MCTLSLHRRSSLTSPASLFAVQDTDGGRVLTPAPGHHSWDTIVSSRVGRVRECNRHTDLKTSGRVHARGMTIRRLQLRASHVGRCIVSWALVAGYRLTGGGARAPTPFMIHEAALSSSRCDDAPSSCSRDGDTWSRRFLVAGDEQRTNGESVMTGRTGRASLAVSESARRAPGAR